MSRVHQSWSPNHSGWSIFVGFPAEHKEIWDDIWTTVSANLVSWQTWCNLCSLNDDYCSNLKIHPKFIVHIGCFKRNVTQNCKFTRKIINSENWMQWVPLVTLRPRVINNITFGYQWMLLVLVRSWMLNVARWYFSESNGYSSLHIIFRKTRRNWLWKVHWYATSII